jgi:hypothetical protein
MADNNTHEKGEKHDDGQSYQKLLRTIRAQTGGSSLPIAIPEAPLTAMFQNSSTVDKGEYADVITQGFSKKHTVRLAYGGENRIALTVTGIAAIRTPTRTPYNKSNIDRIEEIAELAECMAPGRKSVEDWAEDHVNYLRNV